METTDKASCNELAALLVSHGVRRAVVSPGSRNAPLYTALKARGDIDVTVIVDERCAGFYALGQSVQGGEPVVVVCTSGTALLNLAPATAEAYYRCVPLIVVSADRPAEWIDQDDSQTLRQYEALSPYVKGSYDIPAVDTPSMRWMTNRLINDAMLTATSGRQGPVHINVQLDVPLGGKSECHEDGVRVIGRIVPEERLSTAEARLIGRNIFSPVKVMIVTGFMPPDNRLNTALRKLASKPNIVVLTETVSNLHGEKFIGSIDSTLCRIDGNRIGEYVPDVVITAGGALVSRFIKKFLRENPPREHWHVGHTLTTVDCFKSLTSRIDMSPAIFFRQLASAVQPDRGESGYASMWHALKDSARRSHEAYVDSAPWSDMKVFGVLSRSLPVEWNIHYSNGTPIRYSQLFPSRFHRVDCNRGVSGIDGCTSTALGASSCYRGTTLLVTGDMSAQYDIGALMSVRLSGPFKMIVMMNGGGAIFRFVDSTSGMDCLDEFVSRPARLPLREICHGVGARYFEAHSADELSSVLIDFITEKDKAAVLAVYTDSAVSAMTLKNYFKNIK